LETILSGDRPDRYAASFWRHFFHKEHDAEGTADAMLSFQKRFDWDFMKINPRADYHVQDWGKKLEYSHNEFKNHRKVGFPVKTADDWSRIEPLPASAPVLAEHLKAVSLIRKGVGRDLPILMTVFTPLSLAGRLVARHETLIDHIRAAPDKVERALGAITKTFAAYVVELRNAGADGIFYATTHWASKDKLTWAEYERFGLPYDTEVIRAIDSDAINLLHICNSNNFLKELAGHDYKATMYNWDSSNPTNLPIDRSYDLLKGKAIVGGIDDKGWLRYGGPDEIGYKIDELKERLDPSRVILGPDCAIAPEVPFANLQAVRERL
jgi:uroporphyrinogen decarboxylase